MQNPFSISFGTEPIYLINRPSEQDEIVKDFLAEVPVNQVYMITGVRGSGKTVLLSSIANSFREWKDWVVVDLSPERDMLHTLAAELTADKKLSGMFAEMKVSLSVPFVNFELSGQPAAITDITVELNKLLGCITEKGKRVLITVDEVVSNKYMREFASQFQIFLRKRYNIFLIMAGLYQNVNSLQNEKALTFLYRAPRQELAPLNIYLIQKKYQEVFDLEEHDVKLMADVTKGYPYAFQALGYLCFKTGKRWEDMLPELDAMLEDYCYDKIWSELSEKDMSIIRVMSVNNTNRIEEIRKELDLSSNEFTVYRKRLIKKGLVKGTAYGKLELVLPRFREFVMRIEEM